MNSADKRKVFSGVSHIHFARVGALFSTTCCQGCCQEHEIGWRTRVEERTKQGQKPFLTVASSLTRGGDGGESNSPYRDFDPLWVCLERVQDSQQADALFVFVRLSSSEITDVAARIAAMIHYGTSITCVFGMGTGVSLLGFRGVVDAIYESLAASFQLSYCIADIH